MLNATEATRQTLDQIYRNHLPLFDKIEQAVDSAIEDEKFSVQVDFPGGERYVSAVEYKLQSMGYKVQYFGMKDDYFTSMTVSWFHKIHEQ